MAEVSCKQVATSPSSPMLVKHLGPSPASRFAQAPRAPVGRRVLHRCAYGRRTGQRHRHALGGTHGRQAEVQGVHRLHSTAQPAGRSRACTAARLAHPAALPGVLPRHTVWRLLCARCLCCNEPASKRPELTHLPAAQAWLAGVTRWRRRAAARLGQQGGGSGQGLRQRGSVRTNAQQRRRKRARQRRAGAGRPQGGVQGWSKP